MSFQRCHFGGGNDFRGGDDFGGDFGSVENLSGTFRCGTKIESPSMPLLSGKRVSVVISRCIGAQKAITFQNGPLQAGYSLERMARQVND